MTSADKPSIFVTQIEPDIALITIDAPDSSANVLNDQLFDQLDSAMKELMERDELTGVILTSAKPKIFVAGADLKQI